MVDESGFRGGSEVVLRSFEETGTWFHSFCDEVGYVCGSLQDLAPKEVLWLVRMEGCPRDTFFNFVSKRQNRKFESGSQRKSRCFRTSVVEPNNLTRISEYLQLCKLSNVCRQSPTCAVSIGTVM